MDRRQRAVPRVARARVDAGLLRGLVLIDMAVHQGQMAKFFGGTALVMVVVMAVVMAVVVVVVMVHRVVGQWWDLGIVTGKFWWIIAVAVIVVVVVVVIVLLLLNIVSEILTLVLVLGIIGLCRFKVGLDSSVGCIYGAGHRGHHLLARHTAILTLALAALE